MKLLHLILLCSTHGIMMAHGQDDEPTEGDRGPPMPLFHPEPVEEEDVPGTFQSDMLLTLPQAVELYASVSEQMSGNQKRRSAVGSVKWPHGIIPYEIDDNFGEEIRITIQEAMDLWEENTCITFREYTAEVAEELGSEHRVLFQKASSGCVSWIGMVNRFPQTIALSETSCDYKGTIAHEIGHAVGWYHEHARPDRDQYVTVLSDNIRAGSASNFRTFQVETYDVPYDIESIMHYGSKYFTKERGVLTIEPKNPLDLFKMGNREDFTFYDRKNANVMYECSSECDPHLQCENEGYVGKDCICHCKPDYSGMLCEIHMKLMSSTGCMGELSAGEEPKTMMSPGYPYAYDRLMTCAWLIQGPPGSTLSLVFTDFDVEQSPRNSCYDYIRVRSDSYIYTGGEDLCGDEIPPPIVSAGNQIMVILYTDGSGERRGFRANYFVNPPSNTTTLQTPSTTATTTAQTTVQTTASASTPVSPTTYKPTVICETVEGTCGGEFTDSGCIASPNYGHGLYSNNQECVYHIQVDAGKRVQFTVQDMDIEEEETCRWDKLAVIPGNTLSSLRVCGSVLPLGSFVSIDNTMTVKMISDEYVAKGGFVASFQGITVD